MNAFQKQVKQPKSRANQTSTLNRRIEKYEL